MKDYEHTSCTLEIETDQLSSEDIKLTLECAYNVKKNLRNQVFTKSRIEFTRNLEAINTLINSYESAFVKTLAF